MRLIAAALGAGLALAGCEETATGEPLIGPDRSFGAALEIGAAQWEEVGDLADMEGRTRWVELPASGSGDYRGVVTGWASGGVPVDYVADLALEVDFDRREVSGSVENLVTEGVAGFGHPDGQVPLSGVVARDAEGNARIVVDGSGLLRGPGMEATLALDAAGSFAGDEGQALFGQQATDFVWTRGYLEGTVSRSDGVFSAVEVE
jgi:hypothetical protein